MLRLCALTLFLAGTTGQAAHAAMTPRSGQVPPNIGRGVAPGQAWPLGSIVGAVGQSTAGNKLCGISSQNSSFITGPATYLQINELDYNPPGDYANPIYSFYGPARLTFTSATSGTLTFDNFFSLYGTNQVVDGYPLLAFTFSGYTATSPDSHTLQVSFTLNYADCSVPFTGTYHHQ